MNDELRDEYQFDYGKAKPNRFAAGLQKGGRLVVLDPEVAALFQGSQSVNAVLRGTLENDAQDDRTAAERRLTLLTPSSRTPPPA